jgi:predicted PurR-regulated permease PerM
MQREVIDGLGLSRHGVAVTRVGIVAWAGIGLALLAFGAFRVAVLLRPALVSLGLAIVVVVALEPLVSRLERGIPRWAAVSCAYAAILVPVAAGLWWITREVSAQLGELVRSGPQLLDSLRAVVGGALRWIRDAGMPMPTDAVSMERLLDRIPNRAVDLRTAFTGLTGRLFPLILAPGLAFYILIVLPRIRRATLALLPPARVTALLDAMSLVGATITGFLRGQLLVAGLVGVMSTLGLLLLGIPYALAVGTVAGVTNLLPFFGPIVGSLFGVLLGLAEGGPWLGLSVLVLFVVVQQVESLVLSPLLVGRTVRLRPFAVMLAVLAGTFAAGILGMIIAVPIVASVKALFLRFAPVEAGQPAPG